MLRKFYENDILVDISYFDYLIYLFRPGFYSSCSNLHENNRVIKTLQIITGLCININYITLQMIRLGYVKHRFAKNHSLIHNTNT